MEHSLQAEGFGVRLRPVLMDDATFIVWLRNLNHAKGRVGDSATDAAGQEAWLKTYFEREGDYYFVIETKGGVAMGTCGIYGEADGSAEWGRWIIRPEAPCAISSAILAFDLAFDRLGLSELRIRAVASNQPVLSLIRKFGCRRIGIEPAGQIIGGKAVDLARFVLTTEDWSEPREWLVPLARLAETQIHDWEQTQRSKPDPR